MFPVLPGILGIHTDKGNEKGSRGGAAVVERSPWRRSWLVAGLLISVCYRTSYNIHCSLANAGSPSPGSLPAMSGGNGMPQGAGKRRAQPGNLSSSVRTMRRWKGMMAAR